MSSLTSNKTLINIAKYLLLPLIILLGYFLVAAKANPNIKAIIAVLIGLIGIVICFCDVAMRSLRSKKWPG